MSKARIFVLAVLAALMGCQPSAMLIRMVPDRPGLEENELSFYSDSGWFLRDKIAIIDVDGLLMNQTQTGLFANGENPVSLFIEKLQMAQQDEQVKAVVLRLNTPGGGVGATDSMYHALMTFRAQTRKPVISLCLDVTASGGYYLACGTDGIMAQPSTLTGSIGTIMQTVSFEGTMNKIGVKAEAIKSGQLKDIASPLHDLQEDERALLKGIILDYYQAFIEVVLSGRPKLTRAALMPLADGRVFTANQALNAGLLDAIGYPADAIAWAKRLAGTKKAKVVIYQRSYGNKATVYASTETAEAQNLVNIELPNWLTRQGSHFLYLWQCEP